MSTNRCRHFLGLFPDDRPACKRGWNVRKWALLGNNGSEVGIGLRLPCTKQSGDVKPLFDCPSVDRKTDAELEKDRAKMSERMDLLVKGMSAIESIKQKMIENNQSRRTDNCPWCDSENTLQVYCNVGGNNHIKCQCTECKEGFLE
jgi:hypothetical protein